MARSGWPPSTPRVAPPAERKPAVWLLTLAGLLGFWCFASQRNVDQDLFGHLTFGRDAWAAGHVLTQDPYSYVPHLPVWYNHEWLWETSAWWLYAHGGASLLLLAKALCGVVLFTALAALALRRGATPLFIALMLSLAALGIADHVFTRPLVFTYMAFPLCLLLLEHIETKWALPALVGLFLVWANMHAAFVVGLGCAAIYAVPGRSMKAAAAAGLGALAACVNPYGVAYWPFVLHAVTMKRPYITEFRPVPWSFDILSPISTWHFILPWYKLTLMIVAIALITASRRDLRAVALLVITAVMSLSSYRHMPLFLITAAAFAPELFASRVQLRAPRLAPALFTILVAGLWAVSATRAFTLMVPIRPVPDLDFWFPYDGVRFLKANNLHGNIACMFDWGEFLIWELPQDKVSFDGRLETVYPESTVQANLQFTFGDPGWSELLDRWPTDIVIMPDHSGAAKKMFTRHEFTPAWHGDGTAIFVRRPPPYINPPTNPLPDFVPLSGPPSVVWTSSPLPAGPAPATAAPR